jgi:undecaprenyl phosphate N,N'-diacetylbacillosamine 1-phosphate transferase
MSIIGPRPLLPSYIDLYSERHKMRHNVRPGLSCGRLSLKGKPVSSTWTWREQFENDIFYIENVSFWLDLRMIFATVKAAIKGSKSRSEATRISFDGFNLDDTRTKQEALRDEAADEFDEHTGICALSGR